ncbi:MAG TPA: chemotaxis-specific protein-glutamate methyltransferase CheB [Methylophilaceae bacterium]
MVVEDSAVIREFLVHILGSEPGIQVVGTANDGQEAIEAMERMKPDIVTMDIHMPRVDGLEATRRIMETYPVPIVIVSGASDSEMNLTFQATEAGAVAFVPRPTGFGHPTHETTTAELVKTVKLMAEIKVVRRWPKRAGASAAPAPSLNVRLPQNIRVVAIGASTGGPSVLQTILAGLPKDFNVPLLIVQHMTPDFIKGFIEWLSLTSVLPIRLAVQDESILPGHVYVAADDAHMKVTRGGRITLTRDPPENGLRPSVAHLFRSVAEAYGNEAVAGLLTGMGRDGANELKLLKDKGAATFAQDKDSSVVHGMAGEAIKLNAATWVLPPERIAPLLAMLVNDERTRKASDEYA